MSIAAIVRMQPSGHEFVVEPGETLLESALRSGLSVRYSCNSGTCGQCRARLVSGVLGECRPHDFAFTEREKLDGQFLLCRATASTDLEIEAVEARGAEDIPYQEITTSVCKLQVLADNVMELQIRTPRSRTLWFLAGQYVNLRINDLPASPHSIASCPCNGMLLQFHVDRESDDPFDRYVFDALRLRNMIEIAGPYGSLVLDENAGRPLVFIARETGFAAIKSLIEHVISLDLPVPVRLYWLVGHTGGHYLENFCRSWKEVIEDYVFTPMVADQDSSLFRAIPEGFARPDAGVEQDLLQVCLQVIADLPDLSGWDVYVSGAGSGFTRGRDLLLGHGLPQDRLFSDNLEHG